MKCEWFEKIGNLSRKSFLSYVYIPQDTAPQELHNKLWSSGKGHYGSILWTMEVFEMYRHTQEIHIYSNLFCKIYLCAKLLIFSDLSKMLTDLRMSIGSPHIMPLNKHSLKMLTMPSMPVQHTTHNFLPMWADQHHLSCTDGLVQLCQQFNLHPQVH